MSGGSGYGYGYGAGQPGASRYDTGDSGYGNGNTGGNGYNDRGPGSTGGGAGGDRRGNHDRRPGGYGGFYPESTQQPSLAPPGPPSPERRRDRADRDRQQQPAQSTSRSRTRNGEADRRYQGPREDRTREAPRYQENRSREPVPDTMVMQSNTAEMRSVEDVLESIQRDWDFMTDAECIPVQVALSLMDTSTLGKADREPDFINMYNQIQRTLKAIVNEHHQGFNSSIGTYHMIQSNISSSQGRVRNLRNSLEEAKSGLLSTKPELKGLATSSQNYDDILQLFAQIEEIQSLPEKLESRISDKRFLAAVEVLHTGLRLLRRSELEEIGALSDVRAYFNNQETSLTDILIEELHDHLYLKSPYCSDRWKAPVGEGESNSSSWTGNRSWERPVYSFLAKFDATTPMVEDASRNPEADTFSYIQLLIEALNKMGHLDTAVDRIAQRLPVELFAVVDKTNAEVDARYPTPNRTFSSHDNQLKSNLPTETIEERGHVLTEYLWALYAKFESIAEGHRVLHDVIAAIVGREGVVKSDALSGGFKELWKLLQSEIRSLLHDYLATDGETSFRSRGDEADARRHLTGGNRDKNKKMFKLSDIEQSSEMKAEQDELDEILQLSVPGLVSKTRQKTSVNDASPSRQGNSGTGHKILLEPSVFNMRLLLPPSLSFIQRLKDIVPIDSDISMSTLTSFLDDFMVNVFLPQLDETITDLCTLSFIAADAFTEDPQWTKVSPRPIFKGTVKFMSIVREFSKMLSSIPHDQAFTQLLIDQIVTYYDKCCGWYKAMVTKVSARNHGGEVRLKAAASFAESGDIRDVVEELWKGPGAKKQTLIDTEIDLLLKRTDQVPLEPYDIISDPKTVVALSLLYNSMQWLGSHLSKIRMVVDSSTESDTSVVTANGRPSRRWTLFGAMKPKHDSINMPVYLPLNRETAAAFDKTLQSLHGLGSNALLTMHVDIRCGIIHMLTKTMSGPNPPTVRDSVPLTPSPGSTESWWHIIMNQPTAASPTILQLNGDLISFDTNISTYLGSAEHWFIASGLARFIDRVFVACTRYIGAMNENGALRLQLDVLVLQQNLKNIIIDPAATEGDEPTSQEVVALPRSAKFLDWFLEGAEKALDYAKEEKEAFAAQGDKALAAGNGEPFTYDELRVLVDLCFSEISRGPRGAESREDFMAAKKASADALLRLNEIMWDAR
ncbi:exocyst subunit [Penicillium ochrochloron]